MNRCAINSKIPSVVVLLAAYNGEKWLCQQLDSILTQSGVDVTVVVSDDCSDDKTVELIKNYQGTGRVKILPKPGLRFGSACANFINLICESDIGRAEYVALSDQDDLWNGDKLLRAVLQIKLKSVDAYSGDVDAFWPDGRVKLVKKSHQQKRLDYLFSSPGPGCTFVLKRSVFDHVKRCCIIHRGAASRIRWHDWMLYALIREQGFKWYIDDYVSVRYRQHSGNDTGANVGVRGILWRLAFFLRGEYLKEVLKVASITSNNSHDVSRIRRFSPLDRFWLCFHANDYRRDPFDVFILRILFLISKPSVSELVPRKSSVSSVST